MLDAYIYDGLRSPIGRHAGKLAGVRPDDLAGEVIAEVVKRNNVKPEEISDVVFGCVTQSGEDCRNVARFAALMAGLPPTTPGVTVNRLCASGLQAVTDAARAITCGEGSLYIAGGVESMTRAPYVLAKPSRRTRATSRCTTRRSARALRTRASSRSSATTRCPRPATTSPRNSASPGSRPTSSRSGRRKSTRRPRPKASTRARSSSIALPSKRKDAAPEKMEADEHPRRDATMEALARLKPLFEGGVVTAGNASGVNDGAAALIVASRAWGEKNGKKPIAKILSAASAAVEPRIMGVGPAYAIPRALERAKLDLKDMDIIEINEAFASQVLGCLKLMDVDFKDPRVNPNGGAIAIGHPLGASGARLALTVSRQLKETGGRYAAVSLCIGVGQGLAVILESVK
jgi:acetyl-CoA C-acetyltransferase